MVKEFVIKDCEKIGGRLDPERGCVLDEIAYGEPSWLYGETKPRAKWLPPDVQKKFWLANFASDESTRQLAETQLNHMGIIEVKGSIYIPLEPCRYSKMHRYKSVIFVPKTCETNSDRLMKFQAVAIRVLVPLDTRLTLTEGV